MVQVVTSLSSIASGTTCGVFTLGMLFPSTTNLGALIGMIAGAVLSGWISFGTQAAIASGAVVSHRLNMSIADCNEFSVNVNKSLTFVMHDESDVFPLHRLSFLWINPIGVASVCIVGVIVSYLTGPRDLRDIDPDLISPVIHRFLPEECFQTDEKKDDQIGPGPFILEETNNHFSTNRTPSPVQF